MLEKKFKLNGEDVTAKELTIGQFKKVQMLLSANDEIGASSLMVAYSVGKELAYIEGLPMSEIGNMTSIAEWLGDIVSPN